MWLKKNGWYVCMPFGNSRRFHAKYGEVVAMASKCFICRQMSGFHNRWNLSQKPQNASDYIPCAGL